VLLGRRLWRHGYGTWSFPGGKPYQGESAVQCALRELWEEAGLRGANPLAVAETCDSFPESGLTFFTTFVRLDWNDGEPRVREAERCGGWDWYSWDALPKPLFKPVASLYGQGFAPLP